MKRLTIHDVKRLTAEKSPHFFSRGTMKYFGQTMKDFKLKKINDEHYLVYAPMRNKGRLMGATMRIFNTVTNDLELVTTEQKEYFSHLYNL